MDVVGRLTVAPTPAAVRAARNDIRTIAEKSAGDTGLLGDIELAACEAITNAYLHGTAPIDVTVLHTGQALRVEVRDHGPRNRPDGKEDGGRGMDLIRALTARWGAETSPGETLVWFEVAVS